MEELQSLTRSDVFILGAGFSKAVNEGFPLAAGLREPIRTQLGKQLGSEVQPRGGEQFEQWLSRLAEDQPYLSPDTNLERSAAFLRVSKKISEILTDHENKALDNSEPEWLAKLIATWHIRQATVISFNYDNLIEAAAQTQLSWLGVDVDTILGRLPPLPPNLIREEVSSSRVTNMSGGGYAVNIKEIGPVSTFRLLKLHGSISWYWDDGDDSGATLQRWPYIGEFAKPVGDQTDDIARQFPGRVPFIAPPSATKSKYLGNRVLRDFWREALHALQNATNIYFLGYSVPAQDQAAMGLIIEGIGGRKPHIHIIDVHAGIVRDNLAKLLVRYEPSQGEREEEILAKKVTRLKRRHQLQLYSDDHPIKDFADEYFNELSAEGAGNLVRVAKSLASITPENLEEPWNGPDDGANFSITGSVACQALPARPTAPSLDCGCATIVDDTLRIPVDTGGDRDALQLTKLMRLLQGGSDIKTIVVSYIDGLEMPVIPFALEPMNAGHLESGNWWTLHLIPFIPQAPTESPNYRGDLKKP